MGTASPSPVPTQSPTPRPKPTASPSPVPTQSPTSPVPTPQPTPVPIPQPTLVPTPPGPPDACRDFCSRSLIADGSCGAYSSEAACTNHYIVRGAYSMPCSWRACGKCIADG